jgi:Ferritin-like
MAVDSIGPSSKGSRIMPRMTQPWSRIQWDVPESPAHRRPILEGARLGETHDGFAAGDVTESLEGFDFAAPLLIPAPLRPRVEDADPLTEAQVLLSAAAEVEHALLVEYLYGCWSIDDGATASEVLKIAIQEMCHFITVQNLLLFVGGVPWLARQDQDENPVLAAYPFTLRPFGEPLLQDWLLTEMPPLAMMSDDQKKRMKPIIDRNDVGGGRVHPVGYIYAKLYWLFLETDQPTADWPSIGDFHFPPGHIATFPGTGTAATLQVDPDSELSWNASKDRGGIFLRIDSRQTALSALAAIASQGEGSAAATPVASHFAAFFDLYTSIDFTQFPPPHAPIDPFVSNQPSPDPTREANRITHPVAASLCLLFDVRYKIMLTSIRAALARDRTDSKRAKLATWAFQEMLGNIKGLASTLARLPCKQSGTASVLSAAPTFALGDFVLPDDASALDQRLLDLYQAAKDAIGAALALKPDPAIVILLQTMQAADGKRT